MGGWGQLGDIEHAHQLILYEEQTCSWVKVVKLGSQFIPRHGRPRLQQAMITYSKPREPVATGWPR
jgi:hypothetical protein